MKIVQVVFENPIYNGTGGDLRNLALARALANVGDLQVISVQDAQPEGRVYPKRRASFIALRLSPALVDRVVSDIMRHAPDLVVVEGVLLADIFARLQAAGCRVVLDMHNVESALLPQLDRARYGKRIWLKHAYRWYAARRVDKRLASQAGAVWVCSDSDAALLDELTGGRAKTHVIPNPVPDWCFATAPRSDPPTGDPVALFVGHLGYRPNIVAGTRLMAQIFPLLRAEIPNAALTICGRRPHRMLGKLADENPQINLVPDPETLLSFYDRATAVLIPLTEGGGTRLKVLEALARGVPVVASAKAVEGLNLIPGETYLQAETDADYVKAFAGLIADPARARALTAAGLTLVADEFGPDRLAERVARAIDPQNIG